MSLDFFFWGKATSGDPQRIAEDLEREDASRVLPDEAVLEFRGQVLARWPQFADYISPWHTDLDWRQAWGERDLASHFVVLSIPLAEADVSDDVLALAREYGLHGYDAQTEEGIDGVGDQEHPLRTSQDFGSRRPDSFVGNLHLAKPSKSHNGFPDWPVWDIAATPRVKPSRVWFENNNDIPLVHLFRGGPLYKKPSFIITSAPPGAAGILELVSPLLEEMATSQAALLGREPDEDREAWAAIIHEDDPLRASILVGNENVWCNHYESGAGGVVLVSSDQRYPIAVGYTRR